jgi:hypothetical protein
MPPEALGPGVGAGPGGEDEDEDEDEAKYKTSDEKPTKAWDVYSYGCVALQVCRIVDTQKSLLTIFPDPVGKAALQVDNK